MEILLSTLFLVNLRKPLNLSFGRMDFRLCISELCYSHANFYLGLRALLYVRLWFGTTTRTELKVIRSGSFLACSNCLGSCYRLVHGITNRIALAERYPGEDHVISRNGFSAPYHVNDRFSSQNVCSSLKPCLSKRYRSAWRFSQ